MCGSPGVLVATGDGDYYDGPEHFCRNPDCLWTFAVKPYRKAEADTVLDSVSSPPV